MAAVELLDVARDVPLEVLVARRGPGGATAAAPTAAANDDGGPGDDGGSADDGRLNAAVGGGVAEHPGARLLDRHDIVAGDLELDLHGERFIGLGLVQPLEVIVDGGEAPAQLRQVSAPRDELPRRHLVGGGKDEDVGTGLA